MLASIGIDTQVRGAQTHAGRAHAVGAQTTTRSKARARGTTFRRGPPRGSLIATAHRPEDLRLRKDTQQAVEQLLEDAGDPGRRGRVGVKERRRRRERRRALEVRKMLGRLPGRDVPKHLFADDRGLYR